MIPASVDFLCRTYTDYGEDLYFTEGGEPLSLSGITEFKMQVRRFPGGPLVFDVLLNIPIPSFGMVRVKIDRDTLRTAYLNIIGSNVGRTLTLYHDIIVSKTDGTREPWCEGVLQIQAGVTEYE